MQIPGATSTDQNISHGALLSVAEITLAISTSYSKICDPNEFWKVTANQLNNVRAILYRALTWMLDPHLTTYLSLENFSRNWKHSNQ
jgi:hypothetical protein